MQIGLLPLYVKLYDDKLPDMRDRLEAFYNSIAEQFKENGFSVVSYPFCRIKSEFEAAVSHFEHEHVAAIVTLHMAYSPSLESVDALCKTKLPIVVLDTTETLVFTNEQNPDEIMYNHGVHGVMDMCSMLTRRGKKYAIAAGHYKDSKCVKEACGLIRAAIAANTLSGSKVGLFGGLFDGMGDFQVPFNELFERFGVEVVEAQAAEVRDLVDSVTIEEIEAEQAVYSKRYEFADNIIDSEYQTSIRACLATRKYIQKKNLAAFSVNFTNMGEKSGLPTMPFMEACTSMEQGIGYAGEGDVLTAAFVGALLQGYAETNFVEIFCPDWNNNMCFLSHMGEMNYRIAAKKPRITRVGVNYSPGGYPYVGYTRMKGGKGVFLNICRGRDDYKLLIAPAKMMDYSEDAFEGSIRGWMRTETDTATFLKKLSVNGATHHSIFVYDATAEEMEHFATILGIEAVII